MDHSTNIQSISKYIDQSLILGMMVYPSSFSILNSFLTKPLLAYQPKYFPKHLTDLNGLFQLLIKLNPLLSNNISEDENEMNNLLQEDNFELLKKKFIDHSYNPNFQNGEGISLIEKCIFFNSKRCLNFLLEENNSFDRKSIIIDFEFYKIGLMEYGALKGNKDIIDFCLEKGQNIQKETLILGLIGHHNELVEWMIEEGEKRNCFGDRIKNEIMGVTNNIEFNENLLKSGMDVNSKNNDKRRRKKDGLH